MAIFCDPRNLNDKRIIAVDRFGDVDLVVLISDTVLVHVRHSDRKRSSHVRYLCISIIAISEFRKYILGYWPSI